MFKRAWIAGIALGLTVTFGALAQNPDHPTLESQPIPEARQEQRAPATDDVSAKQLPTAIDPTPALQRIESAIRDLITEENETESERKKEHELRDLDAQEEMAIWAERMFWATLATVILTAIALYAIVRTLHHTRRAAESAEGMLTEAKVTTKAAIDAAVAAFQAVEKAGEANALTEKTSGAAIQVATDANSIAADTASKQLRAYLAYNGADFNCKSWHFHCAFFNYGSTPAVDVTLAVKLAVGAPHKLSSELTWTNVHKLKPVTIAPQQPMMRGRAIEEPRRGQIKGSKQNGADPVWFYAHLHLSYKDIYGVEYTAILFLCSEFMKPFSSYKDGVIGLGVLEMREEVKYPDQ